MKKTAITCLLTLSMLGGASTIALAAPSKTTNDTTQSIQSAKTAYNKATEDVQNAQINLEKISNSISNLTRAINQNNIEIGQTQKQLDVFTKEYNEALAQEASRIKSIYQNSSNANLISMLITSENLSQFISRMFAMNKLMQLDAQTVNRTQAAKNSMEETAKKLNELKSSNEAQLNSLNAQKVEAEKLLATLEAQQSDSKQNLQNIEERAEQSLAVLSNAKTVSEVNDAVNTLQNLKASVSSAELQNKINSAINNSQNKIQQIQKNNSQTQNNVQANHSNTSSMQQQIVSYAMNFLGRPYVWGALGPNAFDCSGLTHYVYAHFGYEIGDLTYSQIDAGTPVSTNNLEPGDLIFWGDPSAPYHVAIYIGGGQYIQAPRPGQNVDISSWNLSNISAARRIL